MTPLYRAIQILGWAPKQYVLLVATLLMLAAAPVLLSIQDHNFTVDEHAAVGTTVGAILPATDGEGDPLAFLILSGNTDGAFALGAASGILTVANPAVLDYETAPSYILTVRATANQGEPTEEVSEITVTVTLNDVAEAPTARTGAAVDILENTATLQGSARSNGAATTAGIQWSASPSMGAVDPATLSGAQTLSAGAAATSLSLSLADLASGTTYYYRTVAKNSVGTTYGETKSFTTYTIPKVVSILRNSPSPTNATSLTFVVTFSEAVSGVEAGDFTLVKNGTVSGNIAAVVANSAKEYHVTVNGVSGNGVMKLDFSDNNSVVNAQGVPAGGRLVGDGNFFLGEVYEVDNQAPAITIVEPIYEYTQIGPVTYTIKYSEPSNISLSPADISLLVTAATPDKPAPAASSIEVTGTSNTERKVTIKGITGDGTLRIAVAARTATDMAGNQAQSAESVKVIYIDNTAPEGLCPQDVVIYTTSASTNCEMYVTLPLPDFEDYNEPGVVTITNDKTKTANASSTYPVGETIVTWIFTDASGNYDECQTKVTVIDQTPPVVNCPADLEVSASAEGCNAVVTYDLPATDNCSIQSVTQLTGLASGATFPLGITENTFEITDVNGNKTNCAFTVTVVDDRGPVISCLADIVQEAETGINGATVTYEAITATDNCSVAANVTITQTAGLPSGSLFPSGSTINTFQARDAAGNVSTCSFTVTVLDTEAPSIVISEPSVWLTQNGPVTYTVTYYGHTDISLSEADILLNLTGTAQAATINVTGSGNQRTVTLSNITGDGTISISIAAGTASDNVGNLAPAAGPSEAFEVDNTAPGLTLATNSASTLEDVPTAPIAFTISDLVTPTAELQLAVSSDNTTLLPAGTASYRLSGTGQSRTLVITPALHRHGNATLTLSVTDKAGHLTTKQLALTVEAVADKPVVTTTDAAGPEDTWIPLTFSAALVDTDGSESLVYYLVDRVPAGAQLSAGTVQSDGLWKLTPAELAQLSILPPLNFVGEFTLHIRAASQEASNSSLAESASANLIVRVGGINDAPGFSLSDTEIVKLEDFPDDVVISVLNLQDPDNAAADISFTLSPASVDWVNISIDAATGEITLKSVPDKNQPMPFTFTVQANDGSAENNLASQTFSVQILPVNDAPAISIESPWVHAEDFTGAPTRAIGVATPPADEASETITYAVSPDPAALNFINLQFSNGTFTATSVANAWGEKELRIRAFDGTDSSNVLRFTVIVTPENDAPVFEVISEDIRLQEDFGTHTQQVLTLPAHNDWEPSESYTYSLSPLNHPKVTASVEASSGVVTFVSVQDANAPEGIEFTLTARDEGGLSAGRTFRLIIEPVNDAPHGDLEEVAFAVEEEGVHTISPDFYTDVDFDDSPSTEGLSITLENAPAWLAVTEGVVTNARWEIQLTGTPPKSEDGKVYEGVKAIVVDRDGLVHEDLFRVVVTCDNALPTVAEEVVNVEIFMNSIPDPSAPQYVFGVEDDGKTALELEVVEVDAAMLSTIELAMQTPPNEDPSWNLYITPAINQYGDTSFRIRINDLAYCNADDASRTPTYITVNVRIKLKDVLDIPTLITPNNDGANDTWNILGLEEFQQHEVRIFDNRGRVIFSSAAYGPDKEWDGTQNGVPLPDGAYTYQIIFNEGKDKRVGRISIAR